MYPQILLLSKYAVLLLTAYHARISKQLIAALEPLARTERKTRLSLSLRPVNLQVILKATSVSGHLLGHMTIQSAFRTTALGHTRSRSEEAVVEVAGCLE